MKKEKVVGVLKKLSKRWFIDAFTGMAQGLFVTLIIGTILAQIAKWIGVNAVGNVVLTTANMAKILMGAGIGVGIANALKAPKLVIFSAAVAGMLGAWSDKILGGTFQFSFLIGTSGLPGNPIGAYVVSLIAIEISLFVAGKTKLDIILVPFTVLLVSMVAMFAAWPFIKLIVLVGKGIELATEVQPFIMGIIIAVSMGILLTMPTSSAAIWIAIAATNTSDAMLLAGGAAVCGCACQMVGFAVQSFRENKWGGLIAQGFGTSMLQIPNIMRKPIIFIPPIVASAIVGPLSTVVFHLRCNASGGGMGTSGLVGIFGTIEASTGVIPNWEIGLGIALLFFVIPTIVCLGLSEWFRKKGWINKGDMLLEG
ncbi:MAG: PTS sugar transporter subunit IIC [Clostridia bacterium]